MNTVVTASSGEDDDPFAVVLVAAARKLREGVITEQEYAELVRGQQRAVLLHRESPADPGAEQSPCRAEEVHRAASDAAAAHSVSDGAGTVVISAVELDMSPTAVQQEAPPPELDLSDQHAPPDAAEDASPGDPAPTEAPPPDEQEVAGSGEQPLLPRLELQPAFSAAVDQVPVSVPRRASAFAAELHFLQG